MLKPGKRKHTIDLSADWGAYLSNVEAAMEDIFAIHSKVF